MATVRGVFTVTWCIEKRDGIDSSRQGACTKITHEVVIGQGHIGRYKPQHARKHMVGYVGVKICTGTWCTVPTTNDR